MISLLKVKLSVRVRRKGDLSDFECGMVVGLSNSQTASLLGFLTQSS